MKTNVGVRVSGVTIWLAAVALLVTATGCVGEAVKEAREAAQRGERANDLKLLGLAYHNFHDAHRVGPSSWEELISFTQSGGAPTDPFEKLRSAGITVAWGYRMRDITIGTSNFVLAYPATTAQEPNPVLFMDGSVQFISREDLQAALQNQGPINPAPLGEGASRE